MAPKKVDKKSEKGQQKAVEKEKIKVAEDKTFGLKNKNKSKSVQKYIKGVHQAVKGNQNVSEQLVKQKELLVKEEKKKEAQQAALLASLFKGTENIKKISLEDIKKTDPKSIKDAQQIDLYTDQREQKKQETMEDWDQAKLEEVIRTKHGAVQDRSTDIVCKYFLDALERKQYGWFWICPNGGDICKYRHCLPPGYVLKRDLPTEEEDEDVEPLEEIIERERAQLEGEGAKVTLESFLAWKEKKEQDRKDAVEEARLAEQKKSGGRGLNALSGRDLFSFDPSLFVDDAAAAGEDDYQEDEEYWNEVLNENQAAIDKANRDALEKRTDNEESDDEDINGSHEDDTEERQNEERPEQISAGSSSSSSSATAASSKNIAVGREELFLEGDVPDLDEIDD